jgi:uncharacterized protein YndB with AHSA1/START domain
MPRSSRGVPGDHLSLRAAELPQRGEERTSEMADESDRILHITRLFDAPRALVFQVWTDPDHITHWWGPRGYATLSCAMDLRPGGTWRVHSRHRDGTETSEQGVFREIVEPERLVFTHAWVDLEGKRGPETLVTVTFADHDGKTEMAFRQAVFDTVETRDGHAQGWGESFDMLAEHLAHG